MYFKEYSGKFVMCSSDQGHKFKFSAHSNVCRALCEMLRDTLFLAGETLWQFRHLFSVVWFQLIGC